jgi:D-xylonolactonase
MEPQIVVDYANRLGEGPLWHRLEKRLYWLDITEGRVFRLDPATGEHELFFQGEQKIGGYTVQEDGALLLFMEEGAVALLRDGVLDYVIAGLPEERGMRFNDVIADPAGRVFCGTMHLDSDKAMLGERTGKLYRLDIDGSISPVLEGTRIPNGMGFTPDRKRMYYTESADRTIYQYDYDEASGSISSRRVFVETPKGEGVPDGMTVDAEGYVWSARAGGSVLCRYTPEGVEERSIRFPARIVSSVTFGGPDLTDIYITTIGGDNRAQEGPGAGALFRVRAGVQGVPEFFSRVRL